jgi:hypothetical protein
MIRNSSYSCFGDSFYSKSSVPLVEELPDGLVYVSSASFFLKKLSNIYSYQKYYQKVGLI